jgi:hypothetical protein
MRLIISRHSLCILVFFASAVLMATGQQITGAPLQPGSISGTVTDVNDEVIPDATVTLQSPLTGDKRSTISGDNGSYTFDDLVPGATYQVTISAAGFVNWTSSIFVVDPGQIHFLAGSKLQLVGGAASVTVYASSEEVAAEQVKIEERQRVFGFIPNFYVVYDHDALPLSAKLKFKLALKAGTDPVIFGAVAFTAALDQAGDTPDFEQGAKGYGQRMGALYANGFDDIMIGEAILPSLLHQDPRYFYQGTGSKRSRAFHALANALICKGDNGKWEPNYSNVGGDLAAGAISNIYYPRANRGAGIVFENALVAAGGRMANGLVQEFILRRFTSNAERRTP